MKNIYADGTYLAKNGDWHEEDSPYKATLVQKALSRTGVKFETCADMGCGAGLVAEILAKNYPSAKVSGFDFSPDVQRFWANRQHVSLRQEDLLQSDERFDLVLCLDVFEHVEDYIGFLRKLRNHAGCFIFNIPLDMNMAKLVTGFRHARETSGHLHYFNAYTALETLRLAGYDVRDYYFAAGFMNRPKTWKQFLIAGPRWALVALGPKWASTITGGYSLVVTAS